MRQLYYVPVIHTSADLGSLGKTVSQRGEAGLGVEPWQEHLRVVNGFWDAIARYFRSLNVAGMKLYQDGMVAEGDVGATIVAAGAAAGSKNYLLVQDLMHREAILVKTEDFHLVKEELDRLVQVTSARSAAQKLVALAKYRMVRDRLLHKRDRFIAARIAESLAPGETGILFIGAYHHVRAELPKDIAVHEVKETVKVREYHNLVRFGDRRRTRIEALGRYLVAEIT
jgi:hypothetical protein